MLIFLDDKIISTIFTFNKYYATSSHQGRFKLSNNNIQLHNEFKNKYKSINSDSFIQDIKQSISKK